MISLILALSHSLKGAMVLKNIMMPHRYITYVTRAIFVQVEVRRGQAWSQHYRPHALLRHRGEHSAPCGA